MSDPLRVRGLTKDYGTLRAVDDIDFAVEAGEVFGFLGPNGAGKTTTIRMLLGLLAPTEGTATVLGANVRDESALVAARRRVGYLPSDPAFDDDVTGRRVLDLHESVKGGERRAELLDRFEPPLDRRVRTYSSGNVQKLGLVQAFMHDPALAILDEPTGGLDPLLQRRFEAFVRRERDAGTTVFLSSHVLGEVRRLCHRVGIVRRGELVTVERVEALLDRSGKRVRVRVAGDPDVAALDGVHDVETADADGGTEVRFTYTGDVNALVARLGALNVVDLTVEEAPLEEVFLRFYGGEEGA